VNDFKKGLLIGLFMLGSLILLIAAKSYKVGKYQIATNDNYLYVIDTQNGDMWKTNTVIEEWQKVDPFWGKYGFQK
jgi:hypothetical protein